MAYIPSSRESEALYRGRICSFRTPGRAGTTGQKIFCAFNPAASSRVMTVNQLGVDMYQVAVKAATVAPPLIRILRITADRTGGTALTPVTKDSALGSSSMTFWGDAAVDGTSFATPLAHTLGNGQAANCFTQEYAPRLITAAGYEPFDRTELLEGKDIIIRPGQGILVHLDYTLATQNPTGDQWMITADWYESPV